MPADVWSELRFASRAPIRVSTLRELLLAVEGSYNAIVATEVVLDRSLRLASENVPMPRAIQEATWLRQPLGRPRGRLLGIEESDVPDEVWERPSFRLSAGVDELARTIPRRQRLVVESVALTSPGFWSFAGKASGTGGIVGYLDYRNKRRREREWEEDQQRERGEVEIAKARSEQERNEAEAAKLRAETRAIEAGAELTEHERTLIDQVLPELARRVREQGAQENDLAELDDVLERRLTRLDPLVDRGLIADPETKELEAGETRPAGESAGAEPSAERGIEEELGDR